MKLTFLGTGGGRFVTGEQKRRTAGIIVETEETQLHIDPGPGALVYTQQDLNKPEDTEALIVSHGHLDHHNDAEPIIEMITQTYENSAALFANETVLSGYSDLEKAVSTYHQNMCSRLEVLEEGTSYEFKDLKIKSQSMFHSDPKTQGFILDNNEKKIGFWTDTEFSEELLPFYNKCNTMIIYCPRPKDEKYRTHTYLNDIPKITENINPETVIVTHFGFKFLETDLEKQKEWLKQKVDCKVIFANDGMTFPGNRTLDSF